MCLILLLTGCETNTEPTDAAKSAPTGLPAKAAMTVNPSEIVTTPTPEPAPASTPAVELVLETVCPAPSGDGYEWNIAGNYPENKWFIYDDRSDLFIRVTANSEGQPACLLSSRLDGSDETVLDSSAGEYPYGAVNWYDGWVYFLKDDDVWRVKPDGKEKQRIISSHRGEDNIGRVLMIYDGRIYLWTANNDIIETYAPDGSGYKALDVPDIPMGLLFFEKGYLYYGAVEKGEDGGDVWSIYRYNLKTGKAKELTRCAFGPLAVRDGWAYYFDDTLCRTNEKKTENLDVMLTDELPVYRNYLLYFGDTGALCVYDLDTAQVYELFPMPGDADWISVARDSVFLSQEDGNVLYRITFEDGKARLWLLNGLVAEEG